ncbi:MAG: hypothetical protein ABFE07_10860 [Armatimonadia bacterium]
MDKQHDALNDEGKEVKKEVQPDEQRLSYRLIDDQLLRRHREEGARVVMLLAIPSGKVAGIECPECNKVVLIKATARKQLPCDSCGTGIVVPQTPTDVNAALPDGTSHCDVDGRECIMISKLRAWSRGSVECILQLDGTIASEGHLDDRVFVHVDGTTSLWLGDRLYQVLCPGCGDWLDVEKCREGIARQLVYCEYCRDYVYLVPVYADRFGSKRAEELCLQ